MTKSEKFDIISESQGDAGMAQSVEHVIGNDEVISSILITSSNSPWKYPGSFVLSGAYGVRGTSGARGSVKPGCRAAE